MMSGTDSAADDPLQSVLDEAQQFMAELQTNDSGDAGASPFVVDGFSIDMDDDDVTNTNTTNNTTVSEGTASTTTTATTVPTGTGSTSPKNTPSSAAATIITTKKVEDDPLQHPLQDLGGGSSTATPPSTGTLMMNMNMNAVAPSLDSFKASTSRFASNFATMAQRAATQVKQAANTAVQAPPYPQPQPYQYPQNHQQAQHQQQQQQQQQFYQQHQYQQQQQQSASFVANGAGPQFAQGMNTNVPPNNNNINPNATPAAPQMSAASTTMIQSLDNHQKQTLLDRHVGTLLPGEQVIMFLSNLLHVTDSTGFQYRPEPGKKIWCCVMTYYRLILFSTEYPIQQQGDTTAVTTDDSNKDPSIDSVEQPTRNMLYHDYNWNYDCLPPPDPSYMEMPLASLDRVEKNVYSATFTNRPTKTVSPTQPPRITIQQNPTTTTTTTYMGLLVTDKFGYYIRFTTTSYPDTLRAIESLQTYSFVGRKNLGYLFAFESKRNLVMAAQQQQQQQQSSPTNNSPAVLPLNQKRFDPIKEFGRQGIFRNNCPWSLWTSINANYQLCSSYPRILVGPAVLCCDEPTDNGSTNTATTATTATDANSQQQPRPTNQASIIQARRMMFEVAGFRSEGRLPALTWMSKTDGASLWRSSQPKVGLQGNRSSSDELLFKHIIEGARTANAMAVADYNQQQQAAGQAMIQNNSNGGRMIHPPPPPPEVIHKYTGDGNNSISPIVDPPNCAFKIMDLRPRSSALGNRTGGYGYENTSNYPGTSLQFCNIGNIHAVRDAYQKITALCLSTTTNDIQWNSLVEDTKWLLQLRYILAASWEAAYWIHIHRLPVLLHCSHGWDRTSQVSAIAQLILDPYYRTMEGFACLIEKDFMSFGHPFHTRCAHGEGSGGSGTTSSTATTTTDLGTNSILGEKISSSYSNTTSLGIRSNSVSTNTSSGGVVGSSYDDGQVSPIFLQFIDSVHQVVKLYPNEFEFNTYFLLLLAKHLYSCRFGNFLCDTERERENVAQLRQRTYCIWEYLCNERGRDCINPNFSSSSGVLLMPQSHLLRNVSVWTEFFCSRKSPRFVTPTHSTSCSPTARMTHGNPNSGTATAATATAATATTATSAITSVLSNDTASTTESAATNEAVSDKLPTNNNNGTVNDKPPPDSENNAKVETTDDDDLI